MRFVHYAVLAAMLIPVPVHAAAWPGDQSDSRVGTFVGARLQMRLGGPDAGQTRTSLAIAPTRSTFSRDGQIRTRIGEGLALEFSSREAPRATLAGMPVKQALGLTREDSALGDNQKLGISTVGVVAIGAGLAVVAGAVWFVSEMNDCEEHDDEC